MSGKVSDEDVIVEMIRQVKKPDSAFTGAAVGRAGGGGGGGGEDQQIRYRGEEEGEQEQNKKRTVPRSHLEHIVKKEREDVEDYSRRLQEMLES